MPPSLIDNFDFTLFGSGTKSPFRGYISAIDPTIALRGTLIGGSQNTLFQISGGIYNRDGLKRWGLADATLAGVTSSYEWETSFGGEKPLRVIQDALGATKLQVESDIVDGSTPIWYDLLTGITSTRFVFDTWWDDDDQKDVLVFCDGTPTLRSWSGGLGKVASATVNTVTLAGTTSAQLLGFDATGNFIANGSIYAYTGAGLVPNIIYTQTSANKVGVTSVRRHGQLFTTSGAATQIVGATFQVDSTSGSANNAVFTVGIYTNNAGIPGTLVASTTAQIPGAYSPGASSVQATFSNVTVSPSTSYHLVIWQTGGTDTTLSLFIGATPAVGTNISTNSGATWAAENGYLYATVTENTASAETLTGVTPDPSALAVNTVILQTTTDYPSVPATDFNADFLKVIGNQLQVGSYSSQLIYVSAQDDFTNFVVPAVRAPGDPDLLVLDSLGRGITVQKGATDRSGNAVISGGLGDWYTILRSNITVGSTLTEQVDIIRTQTADLSTALAHEFIDLIGDTIVFIDQNNQLREFGLVRNIVQPVFPTLSLDVYTELQGRNFSGGALRVVADQGDTTVYITLPREGIDYMYETRQQLDPAGNLTTQRVWQPPQVRGISRIAVISGITYGHSNANPQIYQLWNTGQYYDDDPSDEGISYESHAVFAYMSISRTRQSLTSRFYFEGYMTPGTELNCTVYQEYQGAKNTQTIRVNKPTAPGMKLAAFYGTGDIPVPGENSLGSIPVGDGVFSTALENPPKFRAMRGITAIPLFEYALDVWSSTSNSQWGLLCLGSNIQAGISEPGSDVMGITS